MPPTTAKLTTAVEEYFADLRRIRASGGATGERSYYPALTNLLNAVGSALRPQVFCVGELAEQGAGHPDFGLYTKTAGAEGSSRARDRSLNEALWRSSPPVTMPGLRRIATR